MLCLNLGKEEIESNMDTVGEIIESRVDTEGDRTGYNVETKENSTKKCLHSVETKEKRKEMHKSYWIKLYSGRTCVDFTLDPFLLYFLHIIGQDIQKI